jgi:hypothetical protein
VLRGVVASSSLSSIGYNERARTLEVEFRNGHIYQYVDVPRALYDGLRAAGSKGRYFNEHIRDAFAVVQLR